MVIINQKITVAKKRGKVIFTLINVINNLENCHNKYTKFTIILRIKIRWLL